MSEVATRQQSSTAVAALSNLKAGLQNVQSTLVVTGGDPYLRLQKDGTWVYGAENIECNKTDEWAINPLSLMHGFTCWTNYDPKEKKKNENLGENMVPASAPLPPRHTLPDLGWEWKQQYAFQVKCAKGEDEGEQVLYKTPSVGGARAVNDIIKEIMKQVNSGSSAVVPVVLLKSDSYLHPQYGKTYIPIFEIVRWMDLDGTEQSVDEIKADEAAAAEAAKAAAAAAETDTGGKGKAPAAEAKVAEKSKADLLREQLAAAEAEEAGEPATAATEPATAADPAEPQRLRRRRNA